jgi:hypothetical protein
MTFPLSKNPTVAVGCRVPTSPGAGRTTAVRVLGVPTPAVFETSSVVEVASGPMMRLTGELTDPASVAPALGENWALSCAVDAANHV